MKDYPFVYTPKQIKDGTGFDRDLLFLATKEHELPLLHNAGTAHQLLKEALQILSEGDVINRTAESEVLDIHDWKKSALAYLAAVEGK